MPEVGSPVELLLCCAGSEIFSIFHQMCTEKFVDLARSSFILASTLANRFWQMDLVMSLSGNNWCTT